MSGAFVVSGALVVSEGFPASAVLLAAVVLVTVVGTAVGAGPVDDSPDPEGDVSFFPFSSLFLFSSFESPSSWSNSSITSEQKLH